ncbi:hypothetical protein R1sor_017550 [Riccia sorocarpa]|uniref:Uncharacterized protein n=1 Tax=Riccia sorocarpa TaxID=122646 RepID=A0ABD3I771_9MARC
MLRKKKETTYEMLEVQGVVRILIEAKRDVAHRYVLRNTKCMTEWNRKYNELLETGQIQHTMELETWIAKEIRDCSEDITDSQVLNLVNPPSFQCISYTKMKAYGNHFRVEQPGSIGYKTYDCGVATLAIEDDGHHRKGFIAYVGVVKEILELNYGFMETPIVLFNYLDASLIISMTWSKKAQTAKDLTPEHLSTTIPVVDLNAAEPLSRRDEMEMRNMTHEERRQPEEEEGSSKT